MNKIYNNLINLTEKDMNYFIKLLSLKTIGGKEYLIKEILFSKLKSLGFTVKSDDIGNIYAIRGESEKMPLLEAHMDIVNLSGGSYGSYGVKSWTKKSNKSKKSRYISEEHEYKRLADEIDNYVFSNKKERSVDKINRRLGSLLDDITDIDLDCGSCGGACKSMSTCSQYYLSESDDREVNAALDALAIYCAAAIKSKRSTLLDSVYLEEDGYGDSYQDYSFNDMYDWYDEEADEEEEEEEPEISEENSKYTINYDTAKDRIYGEGETRVLGGDDKCGSATRC